MVNFTEDESPHSVVDSFIEQWQDAGLCAMAILAPEVRYPQERRTVIVRPDHFTRASDFMAKSDAYGEAWRVDDFTNVAWTDTSRAESWQEPWLELGVKSLIRVAIDLPGSKQLEIYGGCSGRVGRAFVNSFATAILSSTPRIRNKVMIPLSGLSGQQLRVLQLSLTGLAAKECAMVMGVTERTVNHHLSAIQQKLGTQNKIESLAKAIWLGVL